MMNGETKMGDLQLRTPRLVLDPFVPGDLDYLHRMWIDPQVRKYLWDDEVISRECADEEIENSRAAFRDHGFGLLVMRLAEDGREVGFCGLRHVAGSDDVEIYYALLPEHWGRGLATEAGREMLRWGFADLGLKRLLPRTDAPNVAAARVMQRMGMEFWKRVEWGGLDLVCYVLSADQYQSSWV